MSTNNSYLSGLNPQQYQAVTTTEGPLMVIAGAGSGKTRVLTLRIAHLIENGVDPFHILALTFTNKAALEMKNRISKVVGESAAKSLWMGTFHSVFAKILRFEAHHLGYPSHFTIYDMGDAESVIKKIIKEMNLDDKLYKSKTVLGRISAYKNNLITYQAYAKMPHLIETDRNMNLGQLGEIYQRYATNCFNAGAMDFDDILLKANELLNKFPQVLQKYQERFRYILVDEYQDTNHSQYLIVKSLGDKFKNICVVGDDSQSIYAFRGANIANILNFNKDYQNAKSIALEQNYRSTQNIVNASSSLIKKNENRLQKNVFSHNEVGEKITLYQGATDADEAGFVALSIQDHVKSERLTYRNCAVLYRTHMQSRVIEEQFRRRNIPYKIFGGLSFYQRAEIKNLVGYLRVLINPKDAEALLRIINSPARGIGETSQNRLLNYANQLGISMAEVLEHLGEHAPSLGMNNGTLKKLHDFWTMIRGAKYLLEQGEDIYQLSMHIAQSSGMLASLQLDKSPEGEVRLENVQELLNAIQSFMEEQVQQEDGDASLANFLQNISLDAPLEQTEDENNFVAMMSIHAAKGLEFPYVYIIGLEEDMFPSSRAAFSKDDLEEERRLFYVALTRAERKAYLSHANVRQKYGTTEPRMPSRFLSEIDEQYIEHLGYKDTFRAPIKAESFSARKEKLQPSFNPKMTNLKSLTSTKMEVDGKLLSLSQGDKVFHDRFGKGKVLSLDEIDLDNVKALIHFEREGNKNILLKFAAKSLRKL